VNLGPRIYIAGRYSAKKRLSLERDRLHALQLGTVIGTWLDEEHLDYEEAPLHVRQEYALRDIRQVLESDLLILDTLEPNHRGGREVEFGVALGTGITTWVVGPPRNVFHHTALVLPSWVDVFEELILTSKVPAYEGS
jgi:hypothetical protein